MDYLQNESIRPSMYTSTRPSNEWCYSSYLSLELPKFLPPSTSILYTTFRELGLLPSSGEVFSLDLEFIIIIIIITIIFIIIIIP